MTEPDGSVRAGTAAIEGGRSVAWRFSSVADGDFAVDQTATALGPRRQDLAPHPWTWLRQVHGANVVVVDRPGSSAGEEADGVVSDAVGAVLAVHTADCGPVLLWSPEGVVGAAHAGWRGLVAGVIGRTVDAMTQLGARDVRAVVGPHIGPECYEFGAADLDVIADRFGSDVRATTAQGHHALDLGAAIGAALDEGGVTTEIHGPACTACGPDLFSHRARADAGRMAAAIWIVP